VQLQLVCPTTKFLASTCKVFLYSDSDKMTRYSSNAAPEFSLKTFPEGKFESTSQEESRSESGEFHDNNRNSVNCNRSRFLVAQSFFRRKSKRDRKEYNNKFSINRKIVLFPFLGLYKYCKKGKTHTPECNTEKIESSDKRPRHISISLKSIGINHARSTNSLTSSESVSSSSEHFTSTTLSSKSKVCSSVLLESRNISHASNLEEEEVASNTNISSYNTSFTSHDNSTFNTSPEEKRMKSGCSGLDILSSRTEISRRCAQPQSCLITSKEDALKAYTNSIAEEAVFAIVVAKSGPLVNAKISDTRCNTLLVKPNICMDDKNEKESSRDGCDHTDFSKYDTLLRNICIDDKNEKESSRDGCDHIEFSKCDTFPAISNVYIDKKSEKESSKDGCDEKESSRDGCGYIEFSRCDTLPALPNVYIDDKNEKESSEDGCNYIEFSRCNTLPVRSGICIDDKDEKESSRAGCDHIDFSSSDYPFDIFGANANDTSVCPHVLFPSLLNKLRAFFPYVISEDNLWLKYSLVRDGSSISTLLSKICEPKWTILAIETMEGEIFGSFTSAPWRCNNFNYFGRGESFLWRFCSSRRTPCPSTTKHIAAESQLEVFSYTGANSNEQLCNNERIAVGRDSGDNMHYGGVGLLGGHGIEIDSLLLNGSSKPTTTFNNPSLTQAEDGRFTVSNMEIWTTTPCYTENDAINLEKRKLLIKRQLSNP